MKRNLKNEIINNIITYFIFNTYLIHIVQFAELYLLDK